MLAQIKIAPVKSAILIIYDWFNYLIVNHLLADAEMLKDILEDGVGRDFAYDVGEVVDALAEVLGDEVAGELEVETFLYAMDSCEGLAEGSEVAGVGDNGVISWTLGNAGGGGETFFQCVDTFV